MNPEPFEPVSAIAPGWALAGLVLALVLTLVLTGIVELLRLIAGWFDDRNS